MFSEAFDGFCLEDEDITFEGDKQTKKERVDATNYEAVEHPPKWFLNTTLALRHNDTREVDYFKAAFAYYDKNFDEALQCYKKMLEAGDHNISHRCAIVDSIIRSALKSSSMDMPAIVRLLHEELLPLIHTHGEQLQYWTLSLEVYMRVGGFESKYLLNGILLTASVDLAEHWILLSEVNFDRIQSGVTHFRLGCLCRALYLLERRATNSRNFVRQISEKKVVSLREKLHNEYIAEQVNAAKVEMCKEGVRRDIEDSPNDCQPPHDCK
uniref:Uncharacterized protein n=1 Tax=Parascaris univalens TaxID=6257 RepID=A0A915B2L2_PARUN